MFICWCHSFCHMAQKHRCESEKFQRPLSLNIFYCECSILLLLYIKFNIVGLDMTKAKGHFPYCVLLPLETIFGCLSFQVTPNSLTHEKQQVYSATIVLSLILKKKMTEKQKTTNFQTQCNSLWVNIWASPPANHFQSHWCFLRYWFFFFSTCWKWNRIPSAVHCKNKTSRTQGCTVFAYPQETVYHF